MTEQTKAPLSLDDIAYLRALDRIFNTAEDSALLEASHGETVLVLMDHWAEVLDLLEAGVRARKGKKRADT